MKKKLLDYLVCPDYRSGSQLSSFRDEKSEIIEGLLRCLHYNDEYPIKRGRS